MSQRKISPDQIRKFRAGTSQSEIAFRMRAHGLRTTERNVRRWETGETAPHSGVLVPLAHALGVSVDDLFEPAADDAEDEESSVLLRSAYELDKVGQFSMADDLRLIARQIVARQTASASRREAREMVRAADARKSA